jgi:hypothetical protein
LFLSSFAKFFPNPSFEKIYIVIKPNVMVEEGIIFGNVTKEHYVCWTFRTSYIFKLWNKGDRKMIFIFHMILDHGAMYVTFHLNMYINTIHTCNSHSTPNFIDEFAFDKIKDLLYKLNTTWMLNVFFHISNVLVNKTL